MATMAPQQAERAALCDLFSAVGPDAPTLCEGWSTYDLATHLVIREHKPLSGPGLVMGGAPARLTARILARTKERHSYAELVDKVRRGPPLLLAPFDKVMNLVEYFVHHEDVRRGAPGWEPRPVSDGESDVLWQRLRLAKFMLRRAPVGVELAREDTGANGRAYRITAKNATPVVTVIGSPAELTMWVMGRTGAAMVRFDGTDAAVQRLTGASVP
jgi:uncharacterized protein (TIGR03085 family)